MRCASKSDSSAVFLLRDLQTVLVHCFCSLCCPTNSIFVLLSWLGGDEMIVYWWELIWKVKLLRHGRKDREGVCISLSWSKQPPNCSANSLLLSVTSLRFFSLSCKLAPSSHVSVFISLFLGVSSPWRSLHFKLSERYPTEMCYELNSYCLLCRRWLAGRFESVVEQFHMTFHPPSQGQRLVSVDLLFDPAALRCGREEGKPMYLCLPFGCHLLVYAWISPFMFGLFPKS